MSKAPAQKNDAVDLLDADHIAVKKLFTVYRKLCDTDAPGEAKQDLADQLCQALTVHAQIEEEIFYSQVRSAIDDDALLDEAEVEHGTAKDLISQITDMSPEDDLYDAKVIVLGEYIDHHVKEERQEMFVKARKSGWDLVAMQQRKMALTESVVESMRASA